MGSESWRTRWGSTRVVRQRRIRKLGQKSTITESHLFILRHILYHWPFSEISVDIQ